MALSGHVVTKDCQSTAFCRDLSVRDRWKLRHWTVVSWLFIGLLVSICLEPGTATAQLPPRDSAPAPTSSPSSPSTSSPSGKALPSRFPSDPDTFQRGNKLANKSVEMGWYYSIFKLGWVIALFFGWQWLGNWVNDDSSGLSVRPTFWNTLILVGGIVGFLSIFTAKSLFVGHLGLMAFLLGPAGMYVYERNQRVPENAKILTKAHLTKVAVRALASLGLRAGPRDVVESAVGPPIEFIGRTTGKRGENTAKTKSVERSRGYMAAKELMYDAILRRCTDVHIEPNEDEYTIRLRIDGVMYPTDPFDRATGDAVVNIFKVLSAIDITEKRRSQDGSFGALLEGRDIDFRVATQGVRHGESMTIRILDQDGSVNNLAKLGMRSDLAERMRRIVNEPHGMLLTCGPTGAGKSTTLYASLQEVDSDVRNVITIEDPIEYKMPGIKQIEINSKAGQSFGGSLRSVLRQDPDVVMVGEIRDQETATVACQAATTGHMVLSTLHANDTITALFRLLDLGVEPFMVAGSVTAIIGQRLARRLCAECREPYKPDAETLERLHLPAARVKHFFRPPEGPNDCPVCGGLGYKGRVGVYELMEINDRMQDLIREKASMREIRGEARKNKMVYMREEGLRLVVKGITSLEELERVVK